MGPANMRMWQTNRSDHEGAARNQAEFAGEWPRAVALDQECEEEILNLGGQLALLHYQRFAKPSHRADMWRYCRLVRQGGYYMDIKMALLRPLGATLDAIFAAGDSTEEGQRVAQSLGGTSLREVPHLVMSIGAAKNHIYQGNIFGARAQHPLLRRALAHILGVEHTWAVNNYLGFCKFLWQELGRDLQRDPQPGWNYSESFGPIFLFQEILRKKATTVRPASGEELPVDGHYMTFGEDRTSYAATRPGVALAAWLQGDGTDGSGDGGGRGEQRGKPDWGSKQQWSEIGRGSTWARDRDHKHDLGRGESRGGGRGPVSEPGGSGGGELRRPGAAGGAAKSQLPDLHPLPQQAEEGVVFSGRPRSTSAFHAGA